MLEVIAAADILKNEFDVESQIWSVTSFNQLRREGQEVDRWNMLHPDEKQKISYVEKKLKKVKGPVISSSDHMKMVSDQIRNWVPSDYRVLGTDGFGRSDSRENLRHFFEVDRYHIVLASLKALADNGDIEMQVVNDALKKFNINPDSPSPVSC